MCVTYDIKICLLCFYRGENLLFIDDSCQFIVVEYCRSEYEVKCQKYCIWVKKIKLINTFSVCICKRLLLDYCICYFSTTDINDAKVFLKVE